MSSPEPSNGYELAAKILATHPDDAIETMLRCSHGTESDWLEFKAGMTLLQEDKEKGLKPDDLYWNIAKATKTSKGNLGVDLEKLSAKLGPRIASELVAIVNRVQIQGLKLAADCADQAKKAYLEAGDVLFKTATARPTEIMR